MWLRLFDAHAAVAKRFAQTWQQQRVTELAGLAREDGVGTQHNSELRCTDCNLQQSLAQSLHFP